MQELVGVRLRFLPGSELVSGHAPGMQGPGFARSIISVLLVGHRRPRQRHPGLRGIGLHVV
jgi:hypothetical protein